MGNPRIAEPLFPYRHHVDVQIRFNDIDLFGHLNNSVYLQFMDLAKMKYFSMFMENGRFSTEDLELVVVNINCNFYSPTYIEENLEVLTAVASISTKSLVLEQRIVNKDSGDVKCVCQTVMACFDPKTMKSAPVSYLWRQRLSDYEGRPM